MTDTENTDEPKGRNHPEVKKKMQELIKRFPVLGFSANQIRAMKDKYFHAIETMLEQQASISEGKGVVENKFAGLKLKKGKVWDDIFGEMDVDAIMRISEDELISRVHEYAKNIKDKWENPRPIEAFVNTSLQAVSETSNRQTQNVVESYLKFLKGVNPKNRLKIIDKEAEYTRLIEYTTHFFSTCAIPKKIHPIGKINLNDGDILYTYYRLFKALRPKENYPIDLFLFISAVFAQLHDNTLTKDNYKSNYIYKKFTRKPNNYDALISSQ